MQDEQEASILEVPYGDWRVYNGNPWSTRNPRTDYRLAERVYLPQYLPFHTHGDRVFAKWQCYNARPRGSPILTAGYTVYSYRTSWPLALTLCSIRPLIREDKCLRILSRLRIYNKDKYSVTTSKHSRIVLAAFTRVAASLHLSMSVEDLVRIVNSDDPFWEVVRICHGVVNVD